MTYIFNGLLDAMFGYRPPVETTILEVLTQSRFPKSYSNAQGLDEKINTVRMYRKTPANTVSNRARLV